MAMRPSISELGPLVQKGTPVPRETVAMPSLKVVPEESPLAVETEVSEGQGRRLQQPPKPSKRPDADLLARYRPEARVPRETVSVKISKPTLDRLEEFIDATKARRQNVWEDALVQFLDRVGF